MNCLRYSVGVDLLAVHQALVIDWMTCVFWLFGWLTRDHEKFALYGMQQIGKALGVFDIEQECRQLMIGTDA